MDGFDPKPASPTDVQESERQWTLVEGMPEENEAAKTPANENPEEDNSPPQETNNGACPTSTRMNDANQPGQTQDIFRNSAPLSAYNGNILSSVREKTPEQKLLVAVGETLKTPLENLGTITVCTMCSLAVLALFYYFLRTVHEAGQLGRRHYNGSDPGAFQFADLFQGWTHISQLTGLAKNAYNIGEVLQCLPYAVLACFIFLGVAALAIYHTRARGIMCDNQNLILQGSGPVMIGIRWNAIKEIQQSRTWDIFNGKKDVLTVLTMKGESFKFRVSDVTRRQDIGSFFNHVRTCAPQAVLKIADEIRLAEPSYTELWLQYFSAPSERTKKGLLEPGMTLDSGRYRIVETVGGGGQGTAYLARCEHSQTGQKEDVVHFVSPQQPVPGTITRESAGEAMAPGAEIVLKEYVLPVHRGQATAEKTADKLKAEAAILGRLDHRQIVKLLDGFIEDYRGYLVLEYVEGETLKALVDRLGPQPETAVIDWALQITDILSYLHGLTPPVVHRDMTPDNLILQESGVIKVVDFNVAHQVDSSATATVVGKHAYIPPEQFRGKPTAQSDIYALGGTLFYLLTGSEPEPISVARPAQHGAPVSDALDAIASKATALDPGKRYQDVAAFRSDLLALAEQARPAH